MNHPPTNHRAGSETMAATKKNEDSPAVAEKKERAERRSQKEKAQTALDTADRKVEKAEARLVEARGKIGDLEREVLKLRRERAYLASHPSLNEDAMAEAAMDAIGSGEVVGGTLDLRDDTVPAQVEVEVEVEVDDDDDEAGVA